MYNWLHRIWYEGGASYLLLLPLSGIYWLLINLRRGLYRLGILASRRATVPVIVVGNITAGGTGKTPVAIYLAQQLIANGFSPGIVSRGYGGSKSRTSMRVDIASDPAVVGDEPVLLARRSGCPVVVDRDRFRATEMLVADGADVIIADDGLQHLRLARDYEICVVDAARGLGNGYLLPAGPLREPIARLGDVDQVLLNGSPGEARTLPSAVTDNSIQFRLQASTVHRLNASASRSIGEFAGTTVHAVAAIGNPTRFFDLLREHGMQVIEHPFPDHAPLAMQQLKFGDDFEVLMTDKDAVKLGTAVADKFWTVPVEMEMEPEQSGPWIEQLVAQLRPRENLA